MSGIHKAGLAVLTVVLGASGLSAATGCPARPNAGSVVNNPTDAYSAAGILSVAFTLRSELLGYLEECYTYQTPSGAVESPTLRLNPGDQLSLALTNRLTYVPPPPPGQAAMAAMPGMAHSMSGMRGMDRTTAADPCTGGTTVATSTNIHFHGLNIPPKCHQDEIISTIVENTDPTFQYQFQVPKNDSPGMYWYHPHVHGTATLQLNGGAAGALIVSGMENVKPQVAGLPERVLIIRQQFTNPNSWIAGPYQLTLNYQPATYPTFQSPIIQMQPGVKEFWRVANASTQAFLSLQVRFGNTPQSLELIALDGHPLIQDQTVKTINLPPAGRAEFIMTGPAANQTATFFQSGFDAGPIGNPNPTQQLAVIQAIAGAKEPPAMPAASATAAAQMAPDRFLGLSNLTPTAKRKIYFSEATNGTNGPTQFFITLDGQVPKAFQMTDPPSITTTVGAVEDWTVENRTGETHAFHIHQVHFLYFAKNGVALTNPELQDTVIVPAWSGTGGYPSVTMRLDFRDPSIAGKFVYHCHVLDHEDAGMMAIIQVNPK